MKALPIISLLLIAFLFAVCPAKAQEPFNVPCVDLPKYIIDEKPMDFTTDFVSPDTSGNTRLSRDISKVKDNIQPFSKQNIGMSLSGNQILPNISINLVQYRLGLYSYQSGKNKQFKNAPKLNYGIGDTIRVYLPLLLISKFNTSYDTSNLASVCDMTSFVGSPLTFRFMPSYSFRIGLENTLTIGHTSDLRTIVYNDSASAGLKTDFGYYGTFGIKYAGKGEVRDDNTGTTYAGNWSFSTLLYAFFTNKNIQNQLFEDQDKMISGVEAIFKFTVAETKITKFNLFASFQYQFNKPENLDPMIFKFGIGN